MKAVAIIVLSLVIIVASIVFLSFTSCAIGIGDALSLEVRSLYGFVAMVALVCIVGCVTLISKLNKSD